MQVEAIKRSNKGLDKANDGEETDDNELAKDSVVKDSLTTASDEKSYKVNNERAVQFRKWVNRTANVQLGGVMDLASVLDRLIYPCYRNCGG